MPVHCIWLQLYTRVEPEIHPFRSLHPVSLGVYQVVTQEIPRRNVSVDPRSRAALKGGPGTRSWAPSSPLEIYLRRRGLIRPRDIFHRSRLRGKLPWLATLDSPVQGYGRRTLFFSLSLSHSISLSSVWKIYP